MIFPWRRMEHTAQEGAGLAQPPGKEKRGPATVFNHLESDPEKMETDLSQKWSVKD